jgi:hypothetical protein
MGRGASARDDHADLVMDQIGHQRRQSVVLTVGPTVFDRHVQFAMSAIHSIADIHYGNRNVCFGP